MYNLVQNIQNGPNSVTETKIGIIEKEYLKSDWASNTNIWGKLH